jgi:hypothetical protein
MTVIKVIIVAIITQQIVDGAGIARQNPNSLNCNSQIILEDPNGRSFRDVRDFQAT